MRLQMMVHMLAVCSWTAGYPPLAWAAQSLHLLTPYYATPGQILSLSCECRESHCMSYWGRKLLGLDDFQFLLLHNQADISTHGSQAFKKKFKASIRSRGSKAIYSLTFHELLKEDAGLYFCILKEKSYYYLGSVTYLRTEGPFPSPSVKPSSTTQKKKPLASCPCPPNRKSTKGQSPQGCSHLLKWSLIGVLLSLAVVLIITLLYFSRLPKKCPHQLVKK
ncbi:hypothetical protein AGOR_G00007790 [Albula goreensis]|uniref:Ig-like domain-containing protein n=1 Tax=Albula goreensis TaxID=1534307 RepID=A0A8T3E5T6_9TELE|nr:hypothetical protein AGOR_G00007790 [Albula goreensis]